MQSRTHSIKIIHPSGLCVAYLSHKGRTAWSYSQARRHLTDWVCLHGPYAELVKN